MARAWVPVLAAAAAAALATCAAAADEPAAYGVVSRGGYKLVSVVRLELRGGEMKGVWMDERRRCTATRRLAVTMRIDLVRPNGRTSRVRRARVGLVQNCAEGGPNFGFARSAGDSLAAVRAEVVDCRSCARLVDWREQVARERRAAYAGEE